MTACGTGQRGPGSTPSWPRAPTARSRTTSRPTGQLEPGDLLKIDFGARVGGYHADMTRTVLVGGGVHGADDWQREIYETVRRAQQAGRDALGAGPTGVRGRRGRPRVIVERGSASTSATAWATESGCRSTRRRSWVRRPPINSCRPCR